jgi:hypothetical protein
MVKIPFGRDIFSLDIFLLIENALDEKIIQIFLLLLILCEGEGEENCYTLCGVPVQAQAVNLQTLVNVI